MVLAYDEATGETDYFTVTAVLVHYDPGTILLTIDGETIETTIEHPLYTWQRGWVNAGDLEVGDWIYNTDESYGVVEALVVEAEPQVMYNLTVAVAHTFFVGEEGWLVHNTNWQCKVGGTPPRIIRVLLSCAPLLVRPAEVARKPLPCQPGKLLQGAALLKAMRCARHDLNARGRL